jgi:hypothetical protein
VIKRATALLLLLAFGCVIANAADKPCIARVISPSVIVLTQGDKADITEIEGKPVYYCGLDAFRRWAHPLLYQQVYEDGQGNLDVMVDDRVVSIQSLLVENGWLQPDDLDDAAQAAITERRGGWNCASTETPFDLMHRTVDPKVLAGIALNESDFDGHPWPWTLNVAGRGYFFRHREGAYHVVQYLLSQGRCDFDVGIMQINWCYHHQRFQSAWDALAPATNIRVAEDILNENYSKTHSIAEAIAYYHSANPEPGREYFSRFVQHFAQLENGL